MKEDNNKFNEGDTVYGKLNPTVKMMVRRYIARIYYCSFVDNPEKKELALFERELV